jgi:hypothetical protein
MVGSLEKINSGKLWLTGAGFSSQGPSVLLWELNDDNSWREVVNISELLTLDGSDFVFAASITKSGKILCFVFDTENVLEGMRFYLVDFELDSGYRELVIDTSEFIGEQSEEAFFGSIRQTFSLKKEQFLIQDHSNSLYILDIAGETIQPVPLAKDSSEWNLFSAAELDEVIYVLYEDWNDNSSIKFNTLDLSTGVLSDIDKAISEEFEELLAEHKKSAFLAVIPTMDGEYGLKERLTICLANGIFEYSGGEVKRIADAEGTVLADPTKTELSRYRGSLRPLYLHLSETQL